VADGNAKGRGKFGSTSFLGFWAETAAWSSFMPGWEKCIATSEDKMMRSDGGRSQVHSQFSLSSCVVAEEAGSS